MRPSAAAAAADPACVKYSCGEKRAGGKLDDTFELLSYPIGRGAGKVVGGGCDWSSCRNLAIFFFLFFFLRTPPGEVNSSANAAPSSSSSSSSSVLYLSVAATRHPRETNERRSSEGRLSSPNMGACTTAEEERRDLNHAVRCHLLFQYSLGARTLLSVGSVPVRLYHSPARAQAHSSISISVNTASLSGRKEGPFCRTGAICILCVGPLLLSLLSHHTFQFSLCSAFSFSNRCCVVLILTSCSPQSSSLPPQCCIAYS